MPKGEKLVNKLSKDITEAGGRKAFNSATKIADTVWISYREEDVDLEVLEKALEKLSKEGFGYYSAVSAADFGMFLGREIAIVSDEYDDSVDVIYTVVPIKYYGKYPDYTRIKEAVERWFNVIEIKTGGKEYFGLLKYYSSIDVPAENVLKWINSNHVDESGLEYIIKVIHSKDKGMKRVADLVMTREECGFDFVLR